MAESSEGSGAALVDEWHRHAEVLVDPAQLPEVGELAWACHVTDGREDRVLHDRAEQDVRTEALRMVHGFGDQRRGLEAIVAGAESVAVASQ